MVALPNKVAACSLAKTLLGKCDLASSYMLRRHPTSILTMTSSSILSPFQNLNITAMQKDTPRLDLDSYISNYDGPLRLDRLIAIAKAPSILSLDALRLAVAAARSGNDTGKYTKLVEGLQQVAPNDPLAQLDKEYVSETNRKVKAESDRLEFELKQYKNNLIKESIRVRSGK